MSAGSLPTRNIMQGVINSLKYRVTGSPSKTQDILSSADHILKQSGSSHLAFGEIESLKKLFSEIPIRDRDTVMQLVDGIKQAVEGLTSELGTLGWGLPGGMEQLNQISDLYQVVQRHSESRDEDAGPKLTEEEMFLKMQMAVDGLSVVPDAAAMSRVATSGMKVADTRGFEVECRFSSEPTRGVVSGIPIEVHTDMGFTISGVKEGPVSREKAISIKVSQSRANILQLKWRECVSFGERFSWSSGGKDRPVMYTPDPANPIWGVDSALGDIFYNQSGASAQNSGELIIMDEPELTLRSTDSGDFEAVHMESYIVVDDAIKGVVKWTRNKVKDEDPTYTAISIEACTEAPPHLIASVNKIPDKESIPAWLRVE